MSLKLWTNILQDNNPDAAGGAGGSSGGGLLTPSNAGGGSETPQGGANPPNSTTGGQATAGNPGTNTSSKQGTPQDWRLGLPAELQEDATLRKFSDVPSLAAAYINAQKLIGAEKIAIPGKHASDEDWMGVYKKLGLPEKVEEYDIKINESATLDENFVKSFKENAHKFGILPGQAQKLADWFSEINTTAESKFMEENKVKQQQEIDGLKAEWGKNFDANLSRAKLVLKNFADKDTLQYMEDTGLMNDVRLAKLFAGVGAKLYKETPIVAGDVATSGTMSPKEAKKSVDTIMANPNHPYFLKEHPGHKAAVAEVQGLFAQMFTE